jgi:hypothetical protein
MNHLVCGKSKTIRSLGTSDALLQNGLIFLGNLAQ